MVCIDVGAYPASLTLGKRYEPVTPPHSEAHGLVRIKDDTGESYLFPVSLFR